MKLYRVIIPVSDIEKAVEFYSKLLNMTGQRVSPGRHYFNCDGTILACFDPNADGDLFMLGPNPDHIYISVENLEDIYKTIQGLNSTLIKESITLQPWGEKTLYIQDPFGNPICFVDEKTVLLGS